MSLAPFLTEAQAKEYPRFFNSHDQLWSVYYSRRIKELARTVRHHRHKDWTELTEGALTLRMSRLLELRDEALARERNNAFVETVRSLRRSLKGGEPVGVQTRGVECWADDAEG